MKKLFNKLSTSSVLSLLMLALVACAAFAFGGGTSTAGQDLYDFVVVDLIGGPIGLTAGILALVFGAYQIIGRSQFALGIPAIIGGAVICKADAIATSFGSLLS